MVVGSFNAKSAKGTQRSQRFTICRFVIEVNHGIHRKHGSLICDLRLREAGVATYPPSDSEPRSGGYRGASRRRGGLVTMLYSVRRRGRRRHSRSALNSIVNHYPLPTIFLAKRKGFRFSLSVPSVVNLNAQPTTHNSHNR